MPIRTNTAAQLGIPKLFHYQPFEEEKDRMRLQDVLVNRRVYCSDPEEFNDPWDCKPFFNPEFLGMSPIVESTIREWHDRNLDNRLGQLLQTDAEFRNTVYSSISSNITKAVFRNRFRLYCLSPKSNQQLMWSDYAKCHRGICLQFSVKDSVFGYSMKVDYQQRYPTFNIDDKNDRVNCLLVKSHEWDYEEEYRLVCPCFETSQPNPMQLAEGKFCPIGDSLKSIIVGCQGDYENVKSFVGKHAPHCQFTG